MSLIDELKRRNVFRASAAYLALGWVVTQVTGAVVPALHLPEAINSIVVWVGIIAFPFVVVFSWVYELTPEGLKRESEVDHAASITQLTARRLDFITIGIVALGVVLFAFQEIRSHRGEATAPSAAATSTVAPAAGTAPATAPVATISDQSIAVLPFVNMSSDKEQDYFSDGLSEELLNLLVKVQQLHVAARTSSFSFKGQNLEIPEIAKRLNVAHVLEGSVRKSGDRVRITAQLVRADNGYHLWSETYDRKLDDIFAVQDEIAAAVVTQLKIALLGAAPQAKKVDAKAYALFLQARQLVRQGTAEGYEQSIKLYQQALAIVPDYAEAWAGIADNYRRQAGQSLRPSDEGMALAREAADKALAIDPELATVHAVLGRMALDHDGDLATAASHLEHALMLAPADPDILASAAVLASSLGRIDTAIAIGKYMVSTDPLNTRAHAVLGVGYIWAHRFDESIASSRTALSLSPGRVGTQELIGEALLHKGDYEAALAEIQLETGEPYRLGGLTMAYHALGQKAESDAALAELMRKYEKDTAYNIAYILAYRNEVDRAFEWLDKAVAYRDAGLPEIVNELAFANIRKDPRWLPFLRKINKAPEQLAAIKFDVKLPQ